MNDWHLTLQTPLRLRDRLRLLLGVPLTVRFYSPDGKLHHACTLETFVQRGCPDMPVQPLWARGEPSLLRCMDCPRLYQDFDLDVVLPDEQWLAIVAADSPDGGGVLCPSCMVARLARQPHATVVRARLE